WLRSRRAALPSGPSPKRAVRGAETAGASGFSVSAINSCTTRLPISVPLAFNRRVYLYSLAGVPGFEPGLSVLETDVLTVDTIPLRSLSIVDSQLPISKPDE